ncbi:hypothetical protein ACWIGW_42495 [Nocardia brasiliensis]
MHSLAFSRLTAACLLTESLSTEHAFSTTIAEIRALVHRVVPEYHLEIASAARRPDSACPRRDPPEIRKYPIMFPFSPKTRFATTGMAALTVLGLAAPNAAAEAPPRAEHVVAQHASDSVDFTAQVRHRSVVLRTATGALAVRDGVLQVLDRDGTVVTALALQYQLDGKLFPIGTEIDGDTATLTPNTEPLATLPAAAIAGGDTERLDSAIQAAVNELTLGTMVGTLLGTIIGAPLGCVAGALAGGVLMPPIFLAGAAGGCLAGFVAGAGLGAAAGTILVGGPTALVSLIKFGITMTTPPALEQVPPTDTPAAA